MAKDIKDIKDVVEKVRIANPKRKIAKLGRRMLKLGEEFGEASQAYLSVTSESNSKNKSWADVREELTDVAIVAIDMLHQQYPDEPKMKPEERAQRIRAEFDRKLQKWIDKLEKDGDTSDERKK